MSGSQLLGHKDINLTAKYYVDVDMVENQQAVEKIFHLGVK